MKDFAFDKSLGQNFIYDEDLLGDIVCDAGVEKNDVVVEVGAGAGTLTKAIAKKAGRVISFEIDSRLKPELCALSKQYDNIEFIFDDILKTLPEELKAVTGGEFKVVANLPYYITTPIMFYFLENEFPLKSMTLTVQKEVAEKIAAKSGDSDYGVLSVMAAFAGIATVTRVIPRTCFKPVPNVDSAVVRLDVYNDYKPDAEVRALVKKCFASRRKTLVNNLRAGFGITREEAEELAFLVTGDKLARAQELTKEQFLKLEELLGEKQL